MAKNIQLTEAHLTHGLPLLAELNLPALIEFGPQIIKALKAAKESGELKLPVTALVEVLGALKNIGETKVMRRLFLVVTSTGEELYQYETDPLAESEALRRVALMHPLDALEGIVNFFGPYLPFNEDSPESSTTTEQVGGVPVGAGVTSSEDYLPPSAEGGETQP